MNTQNFDDILSAARANEQFHENTIQLMMMGTTRTREECEAAIKKLAAERMERESKMNTPEINDGGPAFPCPTGSDGGNLYDGMTLRDWFAGQALCGLIRAGKIIIDGKEMGLPEACYHEADAMIAQRNKK